MDPTVPNDLPEREPLPDVTSWAAMTNDELEQRLRAAGNRELAGMDAATPDAEVLAMMLAPEPMHYDPDRLDRMTPCGLDVPEIGAYATTNPALATCPVCTAALVDSQLPPEPGDTAAGFVSEIEAEAEGWTTTSSGHLDLMPEPLTAPEFPELAPPVGPVPPPAERQTVGLEVLTDELRAVYEPDGRVRAEWSHPGVVGIVCRLDGVATSVPEIDWLWTAPRYRTGPDVLAQLLRQARMYADGLDGDSGGELLMPGPDVLAALSGRPFGSYTDTVETRWGIVRGGWYVLVETMVDGQQDSVWLLVESREECTRPDCTVAGGTPWACAVTTIRGRGVQHLDAFNPCAVRIPATTEVEPR